MIGDQGIIALIPNLKNKTFKELNMSKIIIIYIGNNFIGSHGIFEAFYLLGEVGFKVIVGKILLLYRWQL